MFKELKPEHIDPLTRGYCEYFSQLPMFKGYGNEITHAGRTAEDPQGVAAGDPGGGLWRLWADTREQRADYWRHHARPRE